MGSYCEIKCVMGGLFLSEKHLALAARWDGPSVCSACELHFFSQKDCFYLLMSYGFYFCVVTQSSILKECWIFVEHPKEQMGTHLEANYYWFFICLYWTHNITQIKDENYPQWQVKSGSCPSIVVFDWLRGHLSRGHFSARLELHEVRNPSSPRWNGSRTHSHLTSLRGKPCWDSSALSLPRVTLEAAWKYGRAIVRLGHLVVLLIFPETLSES